MNAIPLILGAFIINFSVVVQISGAISVLVCLFFPAVLSMACKNNISMNGLGMLITAENFVKWVDNKLGESYWAIGAPRPQNIEADEKISPETLGMVDYIKLIFFFDYSMEGVNPENDLIETEKVKRVTIVIGFVVMIIILFLSSN